MTKEKTLKFEASAYLQRLIGRELVPNEEMAIVELVKNAYDSGASRVNIFIQPDTQREVGFIRIADDGSGMSENDIPALFMFAGYSERPEQLRRVRLPTGEKGIGRFAADKLGQTLDVYTRERNNSVGIHLSIDWRDFEARAKHFNEVEAKYVLGPVPQVINEHGTTLEIRRLRANWTPQRVDELRIGLNDLLDPFAPPHDFVITLEVAGSHSGMRAIEPQIPEADLRMEVTVRDNKKVHTVISSMTDDTVLFDERKGSAASLLQLQNLHARFLYFQKRPNKKRSKGLDAGVRVYRDGFRIEPFGSRTADWLHIAEKRAKRAGHAHVVPTRLFGFVEISRKSNPDLRDTTSRQALLGSEAAGNLVTMLREQLEEFEEHLRAKKEPRWKENRRQEAIAFEQARLHTLGVVSYGLAHEIRQPLQSIRSEAHNIRAKLGLLGIIDDDVMAAQISIDRNVERIDKNIELVSEVSKGSIETRTEFDLVELVSQEASLLRHRCEALGVILTLDVPKKQMATLNEFVVYSVLVNYVQNALQSISSANATGTIRVIVQKKGHSHYVEVVDDGPGVAPEVEPKLFKKFATNKTGGMGAGLYYCKNLVESLGGTVGFQSKGKGARFWMSLPEG